ncbi:MAG: exodeoxyribonuclease VII small subunit [Synechococcales cyanobacterium RU_4_20]|nr:exodeoxyribonuclease VII small subunit [Synechococcales cyanobacterium RU_4_20]NJR67869.1 exodeoxyribonuclease VII small subunit [Synechococcales cyanobacterium CRU_2_2]
MPRKAKPKAAEISEDWSYESTVANVEGIVSRLETGELELGEVFAQFEQAVTYLKQCEQFLQGKQEQVELLIETLEDTEA